MKIRDSRDAALSRNPKPRASRLEIPASQNIWFIIPELSFT
jgi:hypothetical protein